MNTNQTTPSEALAASVHAMLAGTSPCEAARRVIDNDAVRDCTVYPLDLLPHRQHRIRFTGRTPTARDRLPLAAQQLAVFSEVHQRVLGV